MVSVLQTRGQFQWDGSFTLKQFESRYGKKLPRIISVKDGYSSSHTNYTFASDDMYFVKALAQQPRLVVKDSHGRYLSIPFDYPVRFQVVQTIKGNGVLGEPQTLGDIMEDHGNTLKGVTRLMFERDESVNFHIGAEDSSSTKCGIMTVIEIYKERFFLCHSVINGKLHQIQVVMPVYVDIDVHVSTGMTEKDDDFYDNMMMNAAEMIKKDLDPHVVEGEIFNPEIMLFRDQSDEDDVYDYIHPEGMLCLIGSPAPSPSAPTSERAKERARQLREQKRQRMVYYQNRNVNELVDFGLPAPRPRMPLPQEVTTEDDYWELDREESPTPPVPPRVPTSKDKSRSPTHKSPPPIGPDLSFTDKVKGYVDLYEMSSPSLKRKTIKTPPHLTGKKVPLPPPKHRKDKLTLDLNSNKNLSVSNYSVPPNRKAADMVEDAYDMGNPASPVQRELPATPTTPTRHMTPTKPTLDITPATLLQRKNSLAQASTPTTPTKSPKPKFPSKQPSLPVIRATPITPVTPITPSTPESKIQSWDDVPDDTGLIKTRGDFNACLRLLSMESCIESCEENLVDGELLKELTEEILRTDLKLNGLQAKKLVKFANGWRPDMS